MDTFSFESDQWTLLIKFLRFFDSKFFEKVGFLAKKVAIFTKVATKCPQKCP